MPPAAARKVLHYIDGALCEPAAGQWLDNVEPATGKVYGQIAAGDATDVGRAVDAAQRAFTDWSRVCASGRAEFLTKIADSIRDNADELARAESIDNGKTLRQARTVDIPRAEANFRFFAGAIQHTQSEFHPTDERAINYTLRQPLGVTGLISPWNLPLYLLSWKIAPALATGNTAVAKPSEMTPVTAAMLSQICIDVGLPPGVLNIVHGTGPAAGAAIVEHPDVHAISFTGGTRTGAIIAASAAPKFKKLSLELGGKNPNVIFADADLDRAIATSVHSSFANQGEICLCGSRILVERSVRDEFVDRFVAKTEKLAVGDPLESGTQLGALISAAHRDKVTGYIAAAREDGGEILCGGGAPGTLPERCKDGFFLQPTAIAGLGAECRTVREEIFGPVVTIAAFDDEDEAIAQANDTEYGLSATVWTENLTRAHRVAGKLQAGTVWVNCWLLRDLRVPFGGMKQSGVGREGGDEALRFFTEPKNVCVRVEYDTR